MASHSNEDGSHISLENLEKIVGDTRRDSIRQSNISNLKRALRPLLLAMKIFGLIHGDVWRTSDNISHEIPESGYTAIKHGKHTSGAWSLGKLYCFLVAVCMFTVFAGSVSFTFRASGFTTIARLVSMDLFFLLCALQLLVCALTISRRQHGSAFSKFVAAMGDAYTSSEIQGAPKMAKIAIILCLFIIPANSLMVCTMFFAPYTRKGFVQYMFGDGNISIQGSSRGWIPVLFAVASAPLTAAWSLPITFYTVTCLILSERFACLTKKASKMIKDNRGKIHVPSLRADHLSLWHAVQALDGVLSPLGLVSYGCNIPIVCLFLNTSIGLVQQNVPTFQIVLMTFWNLFNLGSTVLISLAGAHVNTKAHSLTEVIYDVDVQHLDSAQRTELTLLLTNLNQETISPTIGGIFPITKGMILTVFGTIVGYLTILIEFK